MDGNDTLHNMRISKANLKYYLKIIKYTLVSKFKTQIRQSHIGDRKLDQRQCIRGLGWSY